MAKKATGQLHYNQVMQGMLGDHDRYNPQGVIVSSPRAGGRVSSAPSRYETKIAAGLYLKRKARSGSRVILWSN